MLLRFSFLIFFPSVAAAEPLGCFAIDPNNRPIESIEACAELLSEGSFSVPEKSEALKRRGIALRERGEFAKSIQDLKASLALIDDTSTMRMLAWTYREMGRYGDAEDLYTRILKTDTHWQGWLSRCVVRQDMARFEQALLDCKKALQLDEENLDVLFFTARAYSFLGLPAEALPLTQRAILLAPHEPRHLVENVWALHLLGKTSEAHEKAREGLEQFPSDPDLVSFLNETR